MSEWTKDRETCERATPGPWVRSVVLLDGKPLHAVYQVGPDGCDGAYIAGFCGIHSSESGRDANFTERARTRWPLALDRIASLEAERDAALVQLYAATTIIRTELPEYVGDGGFVFVCHSVRSSVSSAPWSRR